MRVIFPLLPLLLAGCMLAPHKIEIQQGNYVDQEMVSRLKPEMTRSQVRFILGTPLVADVFHANRWDYVYMTGRAGDVRSQRKIAVIFEDDKLKRLEGDVNVVDNETESPGPVSSAATRP